MIDQATARIAALLRRPGMTKVLLADSAKVHPNTLRGLGPDWNPKAQTLERIMDAVARLEKA